MTKAKLNRMDLVGQKYGRLTVLEEVPKPDSLKGKYRRYWNCKCDCGNEKTVEHGRLRCGMTKSCGCLSIETVRDRSITHNMSSSSEYQCWSTMKKRCYNPNSHKYKDYGARGILVCDRWLNSFENFIEDMGLKPSPGHSIDRVYNEKGYFKDNCRWANHRQQAINRRVKKTNRYGVTGVSFYKGIWQARISKEAYNSVTLLVTKDFFEACCARKSAENKFY